MDILSAPAPSQATLARRQTLSIVVPAYNEEAVLGEFHQRLAATLDALPVDAEVIYVNDGSHDGTPALLGALNRSDTRVSVIDFSRNFGKEIAMTAGLDCARGDAVIIIDADLQDPPELIPDMVREWQAGHDVVLMRRASRDEGWFKKTTAHAFYWAIGRLSSVPIPADVGDFRLLSRRAVDALKRVPERSRFMKGLFAWIGFPAKEIHYHRDSRLAGKTKWNYWRLWNFALEGITSFSAVPLKVASYVGFATALVAFGYGVFVIGKTLLYGDPVRGYPTLVVLVLFLGGLQLMALGIIGEYLARMFVEVKRRPLYLVQRTLPAARPLPPLSGTSGGGAASEGP
jgi:glycosyltransferase involved in cell wall biosynthesis